MEIINHPVGCAILHDDGSLSTEVFPTSRNQNVEALLKFVERLPKDLCLVIDRHTSRMRVLKTENALLANLRGARWMPSATARVAKSSKQRAMRLMQAKLLLTLAT